MSPFERRMVTLVITAIVGGTAALVITAIVVAIVVALRLT